MCDPGHGIPMWYFLRRTLPGAFTAASPKVPCRALKVVGSMARLAMLTVSTLMGMVFQNETVPADFSTKTKHLLLVIQEDLACSCLLPPQQIFIPAIFNVNIQHTPL